MRSRDAWGLCTALTIFISCSSWAAPSDPLTDFIARADSLSRANANGPLSRLVSRDSALVGSAVGKLLDDAIVRGDSADKAGKQRKFALASRLAELYQQKTGSRALVQLAARYQQWGEDQLALRREAQKAQHEGDSLLNRAQDSLALKRYETAGRIYHKIGDARSESVARGRQGTAYYNPNSRRALNQALKCYERALSLRRSVEDCIQQAKALQSIGLTCTGLGDYPRAEIYLRESIELRKRTRSFADLAGSFITIGDSYSRSERPSDAIRAYEDAVRYARDAGSSPQENKALTALGSVYHDRGEGELSTRSYEKALKLAMASGDLSIQIKCRMYLALNLSDAYEFKEALEQFAIAEDLIEKKGESSAMPEFLLNRSQAYLKMDELDNATADLESCLVRAAQNSEEAVKAQINLGYLSTEKEDYAEAIECAQAILEWSKKEHDRTNMREAIFLLAQLEQKRGNYSGALENFRKSLWLDENPEGWNFFVQLKKFLEQARRRSGKAAQASDTTGVILEDKMGIANSYAGLGKTEEARAIYTKIRPLVMKVEGSERKMALLFGIATTYEREDPDSARYYYQRAVEMIDQTVSRIGGAELRTGFFSSRHRSYFEGIVAYYERIGQSSHDPRWRNWAFETIEESKGRALLALLQNTSVRHGSREEQAVLDTLYAIDTKSGAGVAERRGLEERYIRLRETGLTHDQRGSPRIASLQEVQKALPPGTVLLEYALGDTTSFCWSVSAKGSSMHNLPPRRVLTEQAEKFKASLRRPANRDDELLTSARALFKMLIDPAREEIKDARTLVVIPDGILFETPFEALLAAEPVPGGAWSRQPFLAQQHDIVYAPSASIFLALRERGTRRYSKELVAFGAPDYAAFAPTSPGGRLQFSPLPHARNEVAAAAQAVRTGSKTVYVGRDANEAACKSRLARGSQRVLHFAAHGVIDASDPIYSCIALCPDAEKTEDGLFHTLEILSSPCNVGLVVASACGTARGKVGRGEGIIGLSRAFLGAGAGGVVASLWAVSDESTTELMRIFYGGLYGERLPAAQALNRARMKLLSSDKYSHPYYWSPFVLIGSERTPW